MYINLKIDIMEQKSQLKVMAAGFKIIRPADFPSPRIKVKTHLSREWSTLEKFDTKAARDRRFDELLEDKKIIAD
jgi:hypothetical protein